VAAGICLLIAVVTVSYHSLRVAATDPVKSLRYE
jgi:putative ABC transport system permease protein